MTELKLCPFCGGEAEIKKIYTQTGSCLGIIITCIECENRSAYKATEPEAIAAWNKRDGLTLDEIRAVVFKHFNLDIPKLNCPTGIKCVNDCRECLMQEFEKARG